MIAIQGPDAGSQDADGSGRTKASVAAPNSATRVNDTQQADVGALGTLLLLPLLPLLPLPGFAALRRKRLD